MPHVLKFVPRSHLARNNMAMRMLPGGIPEFDTVEEMIAYQRATGQVGPAAAVAARAPRATREAPADTVSPATKKQMQELLASFGTGYTPGDRPGRGGKAPRQVSSADSLSARTMATAIGGALGGLESYCPGRKPVPTAEQKFRLAAYMGQGVSTTSLKKMAEAGDKAAEEALTFRISHDEVLREMGLNDESIVALANKLREAGLLKVKRFPGKASGTFGETLVPADYTAPDGKVVEGSSFTPQKDPAMIAKARAIAVSFGLACRTRSNPKYQSRRRGR